MDETGDGDWLGSFEDLWDGEDDEDGDTDSKSSGATSGKWGASGTSLLSGILSTLGQERANRSNQKMAREQMDFQERMSNTAYQRAVKDMAAAGINPMLAAKVGGATTPTGAAATVQNALGAGVSSALQGMQMAETIQSIEQSRAQAAQLAASTQKIKSETMTQDMNAAEQAARIDKILADKGYTRTATDHEQQKILGTISESAMKHAAFEANNRAGYYTAQARTPAVDLEQKMANVQAARYGLSKAKSESKFYDETGTAEKYIGLGNDVFSTASQASRALGRKVR